MTQQEPLFLIIFVTLANATGDPPTRFIGPANDRDAAAPLLADDPLLTTPTRINFHSTWADLNGGLTKGRCAGQQPQRDQDGILHLIFLQAPAQWVINAQRAGASRVQALFKAGVGPACSAQGREAQSTKPARNRAIGSVQGIQPAATRNAAMPATLGSSHEHGSREGMVLSRRWKRGSGYGIIDSMGNWHTVHGGTFNCPHCGAFYEVTLTRQPSRDRDYVPCECCGNTLAEWDSSSVPTFRLIQGPNADPTLGQLNC